MTGALLPTLLLASGLVTAAAADAPAATAPPAEPLTGQVVAVAGSGEVGYSGDGGPATEARLNDRLGLSVGADGTLYVADTGNKRLRHVTPEGVIDTVPGTRVQRSPDTDSAEVPGWGFWSPSNAPNASAVGPDGSLYVAGDLDLRRIAPDGTVTVITSADDDGEGGGDEQLGDGGPAVDAWIYEPSDIAVGADGTVYVADSNNDRIRRISTDGVITTVAGGGERSLADADGARATQVGLYAPVSLAVDSTGTVYFTLERSADVYEVEPDGTLWVLEAADIAYLDGDQPAPADGSTGRRLAVGPDDDLYITDGANGRLRVLSADEDLYNTAAGLPATVADIAIGPDGDIYYADGARIWRMSPPGEDAPQDGADPVEPAGSPWPDEEPGAVRTVAGVAADPEDQPEPYVPPSPTMGPAAVAAGPDGVTYVADSERHTIHRVDPDGTVAVLAGTGEQGDAGDGGPAAEAQLSYPVGLDVDAEGNLYVADSWNGRVRRIGVDGVITTVAGVPKDPDADPDAEAPPVCVGEPAAEAVLTNPVDVAVGPDGSVYLADTGRALVCRLNADGTLTTVAGGGERWAADADDHPAVEASLWEPVAVDLDAAGHVYVIENGRPHVRMVRPDGLLVAVAGDSYFGADEGGFAGDGGPAVAAELNTPRDLAVGPDGSLYVADTYNSRVRRIGADGVITTYAGTGSPHDTGDGGPAGEAGLNEPGAIDVGPDGSVVLSNVRSDTVRRIDPGGVIETVADFADPAEAEVPVDEAELAGGMTIAALPDGRLVVAEAERQRLRATDGDVLTELLPAAAVLAGAGDLAAGPGGELYAVVAGTVVRVTPDGELVTVAGGVAAERPVIDGALATTEPLSAVDVAVGPEGTVYVLDARTPGVFEVRPDGTIATVYGFEEIDFDYPRGIAVGPDGTVYVTDATGQRVYAAAPGQEATIFAGVGSDVVASDNGDGGPAAEADLIGPEDLVVDAAGHVYVGTSQGVRRIDTGGTISTVLAGDEDSTIRPATMAVGPGGDLYVVDAAHRQVLAVVRPGEITDGFPWWIAGVGAGVLVLAAAAVILVRRRRRTAADGSNAAKPAGPTPSTDGTATA